MEAAPAVRAGTTRARGALPLSARLVITYTLLVAAALLVVGVLVIQLTREHLTNQIETSLDAMAASFEDGPAGRIPNPSELDDAARTWLSSESVPDDSFVVVRTGGGTLPPEGGLDPTKLGGLDRLVTATQPTTEVLEGPTEALVITQPLLFEGRRIGNFVAGSSLEPTEGTIAALLRGIWAASAVGLLFAVLLGLAAVRRTLRPLATMSREIEEIRTTGDLSLRAEHTGPADEVGRLSRAFDELIAQLDEAMKSQRRFLSDASHELRTPLTVVRGQLELLSNEPHHPDARRSIELAMEEVERTRKIVGDLLLLARLDEGMRLESRPIEVELVLREALLRGMLVERRPSTVTCEPDLYVMGDPDRLFQVLANLVINAVQHTDAGAGLALAARRSPDSPANVEISVSDQGNGIPTDELPHVFERFHRGSAARSGAPGGAGLGLAIAASLVRSMGGDIWVRSAEGEGTTFTLELPAAESSSENENRAPVGRVDS